MADPWDTDDGETHYAGDGCQPPHVLHCSHGVPRTECPDPDSHHEPLISTGAIDAMESDLTFAINRVAGTIGMQALVLTREEHDVLIDAVAWAIAKQLVGDPGHPRFEVLQAIGNKLGMEL